MSKSDKPVCIGYGENETGSDYDWSHAYVYSHDGLFYIVTDSGCSCEGPRSSYNEDEASWTASSMGELFEQLYEDKAILTDAVREAFVDAFEKSNAEALAAVKKALAEG